METQHYQATDNFREILPGRLKGPLDKVFGAAAAHRLQIIYTRIDRDDKQQPHFTDYRFGTGEGYYCYPASTVKLPGAILALEKLNNLGITGLNPDTPMLTDPLPGINPGVQHDHSAAGKLPSISHYIKKIFLVSDNDAFNRLYEFIGQETFNRRLWELGFRQARILHRVGLPLHSEANRHTNPVTFRIGRQLLYEQPAAYSELQFGPRNDLAGTAHIDHRGKKIDAPMDFSHRNRLPLVCLHEIMHRLFFPSTVTKEQRFRLTENDQRFLYHWMSRYPEESTNPAYDREQYHQAYTKFLLYGGQKDLAIPDHIRIYNKPGWAYGFLTDTAYIVDTSNKIEFLLSASLLVNHDGMLGDDQRAFEETGKPFLKALGEMIYEIEKRRERKYLPDFHHLKADFHPYTIIK
ncbi:MAG TPA: serine hydrolase [Chitinophaga sp.]|uniref:serine hydrolase n=1 Tax=Chitinophaga sp. TaxID=1869181 RepID=UPI002C79672A|nr:serine hydrolase [Chitinophaga sp.]HVI44366.1 serine hydrolase [Chitinophaga sp.]